MVLALNVEAIENNGSQILEYSLEISSDDGQTFAAVLTYDSNASEHTLNIVADSLALGAIYAFRMRARNSIGWGEYSTLLTGVGLTALPVKPDTPLRHEAQSDKTQVAVYWHAVADTNLPAGRITGYRLYMAEGPSGQFLLIYDGKDFPQTRQTVIGGLTTGQLYKFRLTAFNINGEGPESDELVTYACQAPSSMPAPARLGSTQTTLTLKWEHPADDGGCLITSFAVFRDDGAGGSINIEANAEGDTNVRNRPTLDTVTVTNFPAGSSTGKHFSFKVTAFNAVQSADSDSVTYILASVPAAPA